MIGDDATERDRLQAEVECLRRENALLRRENLILRRTELDLLEVLEQTLLDKADLDLLLETVSEHADAMEELLAADAERAKQLAFTDPLTQLANRRRLDEYLEQIWQEIARRHSPLSFLLCDVDRFKDYNDCYGHQEGDVCLVRVAAAIARSVSKVGGLAARYGGEEFAVVLPDADWNGAYRVAESIRSQVLALQIPHELSNFSKIVTVSVGCTWLLPSSESSPEELIAAADRALYQAKLQGRNCVVLQPLKTSDSPPVTEYA